MRFFFKCYIHSHSHTRLHTLKHVATYKISCCLYCFCNAFTVTYTYTFICFHLFSHPHSTYTYSVIRSSVSYLLYLLLRLCQNCLVTSSSASWVRQASCFVVRTTSKHTPPLNTLQISAIHTHTHLCMCECVCVCAK